jgi:hypothetical protein
MPSFTAKIYKVGINPLVDVPAKISREFDRRGYVPVTAVLGGKSFAVNLVPAGGGRHRLCLNQPMRDAADRETGERVTIALTLDTVSRVLKTPADLARALRGKGQLASFEKLRPSHRKEIIRWVEQAKAAETRARRIVRVLVEFPHTPYRK